MKHFSCGDIVPGCGAMLSGSTEDEVMQQLAEHAKEAHGMSSMTPHMQKQVKASIR